MHFTIANLDSETSITDYNTIPPTISLETPSSLLHISLSFEEKTESSPQIIAHFKSIDHSILTNYLPDIVSTVLNTFLYEKIATTSLIFKILCINEGNDLIPLVFNGLSILLLKSGIRMNDVMCSASSGKGFVVYGLHGNNIAYMEGETNEIFEVISICGEVGEAIKKYMIDDVKKK